MKAGPALWEEVLGSEYQRAPVGLLAWIGGGALFLFVLSFWVSRDLGRIFEVTAWLALVFSARAVWRQERGEWLWLLMFGWLLFMLAVNMGAEYKYPQLSGEHIHFSRFYIRLFLFLLAGWWLGGNPRTVSIFLFLAAAGLYIEVFNCSLGKELEWLQKGRRVDFGFPNAQHIAVLFGGVLIGALCFWQRFCSHRLGWFRVAGIPFWAVLTLSSLVIVCGAQTRQVFVAFLVCALVAAAWGINAIRSKRLIGRRVFTWVVAVGLVFIIAITVFNPFQGVAQRFKANWKTITQVMQGDVGDLSLDGVGIRILQWRFASDLMLEAPLTGHGGATKHVLIEESDLPEYLRTNFGHFHNGYLEMGVAYGVPGLLMLPLLIIVLIRRLLNAWANKLVPTDFMLFGVLGLVFFAVVNIFESYVMYRTGHFFMCIVGGAIYTLCRPWMVKKRGIAGSGEFAE